MEDELIFKILDVKLTWYKRQHLVVPLVSFRSSDPESPIEHRRKCLCVRLPVLSPPPQTPRGCWKGQVGPRRLEEPQRKLRESERLIGSERTPEGAHRQSIKTLPCFDSPYRKLGPNQKPPFNNQNKKWLFFPVILLSVHFGDCLFASVHVGPSSRVSPNK